MGQERLTKMAASGRSQWKAEGPFFWTEEGTDVLFSFADANLKAKNYYRDTPG